MTLTVSHFQLLFDRLTKQFQTVQTVCLNALVERTEYQGKDLLDVRVWCQSYPAGEAKPTRKGLCLRPATWRELLPAIQEALPLDGARGGEPVEPPEEPDNDQAGGADATAA